MKNKFPDPLLSVCIPTYEMHGVGETYLEQSLEILIKQTFQNFEVVISDNSKTNVIKKVCEKYRKKLDVRYFTNPDITHGMSTNVNNSIKNARGKLVKILFQDDFLFGEKSLEIIVKNFDLKKDAWLATGYAHTDSDNKVVNPRFPKYNSKIYLGNNTFGSPSILTIKNENPIFFDVRLKWFMDCDYYKRCHDKFGKPRIVKKVATIIRKGPHQVTNTEVTETLEKYERKYMIRKHGSRRNSNLSLKSVTLVAVSGISPNGAMRALELSMDGIDFYDVVLISHTKPDRSNDKITFRQCQPTELVSKDPKNKNDYSRFMAYSLCNYIDSDFALVVHNDALVLRPNKWRREFLNYDYLGAPWPKNIHFTNEGVNVRIGNGGFSLRSRKLLNILNDLKLPFTDNKTGFFNEDGILSVYYRKKLEDAGIKFAPVSVASKFSHEVDCEDSNWEPFGYHNNKKVIPPFYFLKHRLKSLLKK